MAFGENAHRSPLWRAQDAARRVEKARVLNNQIFAYYKIRPIRVRKQKPNPTSFKVHQEFLARIAPWLPKKIPHWMKETPR